MDNSLKNYPVSIEIPVAWGEMDAFQHVNNVVYFRYLESARIAYFRELGLMEVMEETGVGPILSSVQCRFKIPLTFPDTVSVGVRVSEVGDDRFTMEYAVLSQRLSKIAAVGSGVIVSYNYRENKKAPLPDQVKRRIQELEGERQFVVQPSEK